MPMVSMFKDIYQELGVSSDKTGVHKAVEAARIESIVSDSFAIVTKDIAGNPLYANSFHADGIGSAVQTHYMLAKEDGNPAYMLRAAPFAIVMNTDDIVCTAPLNNGFLIDNIARNSYRIDDELLSKVIEGFSIYLDWLKGSCGVDIEFAGGETADLPDQTDTLIVDASLSTRFELEKALSGDNIKPGDIIISLASAGNRANYESFDVNDLGSNGYTAARRSILSPIYNEIYPETLFGEITDVRTKDGSLLVEKLIKKEKGYFGNYELHDRIPRTNQTAGDVLTLPPRTYVPVANALHNEFGGNGLHFIAQNSGGGQTKLINFGKNLLFIKDDLFKMPPIFEIIQEASGQPMRYMYKSFNCGGRLDVVLDPSLENDALELISGFRVGAKVTGHVEKSDGAYSNNRGNKMIIEGEHGRFVYPEI